MSEKETDHKLGTQLEHTQIAQTVAQRFKLKFTDYAVDKFFASFPDGNLKARRYFPFDVSRHTILKGLKLVQFQKSKKKFFVLRYWFQQQYKMITIGEFILDKFGCRECENK